MITDGIHHLPPGKIAAIVTYLEMTRQPEAFDMAGRQGLDVTRMHNPSVEWYRQLFALVGQDWLWFSRLSMTRDALEAILNDPAVEIFVLRHNDQDIGLLELDFRTEQECEIAFFGLAAGAIGTGAGRFLMSLALERIWNSQHQISRAHVHTCTLDHPAALNFYIRSGFKPYARAIEIADDPRLDGRLPEQSASSFPLL
jgi:GNAT superfamily N-acetyltransferase